MTAKKDKTKEKEKKKKQKLNGEESRKKIIRIKSPHLKTAKSPFSKN